MPLTYTGRNVSGRFGSESPSLIDLAVGMSRMPRFAGQTRRWYSVLDHALFMDDMATQNNAHASLRLALLLHDAHEALTGDVPTPFKDAGLRASQDYLDGLIMASFMIKGFSGYQLWRDNVKKYDRRALSAEALLVGPDISPKVVYDLFGINETPELQKDRSLLARALSLGKYLGIPPVTYPQDATDHPAVREFLTRYMELR